LSLLVLLIVEATSRFLPSRRGLGRVVKGEGDGVARPPHVTFKSGSVLVKKAESQRFRKCRSVVEMSLTTDTKNIFQSSIKMDRAKEGDGTR
jgi:hypothetical protein